MTDILMYTADMKFQRVISTVNTENWPLRLAKKYAFYAFSNIYT